MTMGNVFSDCLMKCILKTKCSRTVFFSFLLALYFLLTALPSYAVIEDCEVTMRKTPVITFPGTIMVPAGSQTGTVIASGSSALEADTYAYDSYYKSILAQIYIEAPSPRIMSINHEGRTMNVHSTNIPGIGIAYYGLVFTDRITGLGVSRQLGLSTIITTMRYYLVKTSDNYQPGTLSGNYGNFIKKCFDGNGYVSSGYLPIPGATLVVSGSPTVIDPPCKVLNNDIKVSMGSIALDSFTGTGKVVAPKQFSIPLSCDAGANVDFTISPSASGSSDTNNGILNLDNLAASTTAKGVGLQLLFNNAPLKLNVATSAGSTQAQNFTIPLQAQYIQTAEQVTAGDANASATFVISYH